MSGNTKPIRKSDVYIDISDLEVLPRGKGIWSFYFVGRHTTPRYMVEKIAPYSQWREAKKWATQYAAERGITYISPYLLLKCS